MTKRQKDEQNTKDLYVVGMGASAGGLDAISKVLSNFNGGKVDFCVVIVMHLSPKYKSELAAILNKRCKWPVVTVKSDQEMKAGQIYVTPQNSNIHVESSTLMLDSLPPDYSTAPSIDSFLTSLAETHGNKAIGVILSGFGSDGANGIREIKKNKGLTIAQFPDTAEHRDMPNAAIKTQMVDMVLPPEQIFDEISQFIINSRAIADSPPKQKSIDAIFELLEKRSGTNFSLYKPTTIMRRINHRMNNLQVKTIVEYYEMIKNTPRELDFLFETVLIGVTEFFRDYKAFKSFERQLGETLKLKAMGDAIRIWCVGCATGEEPYTIAIMLHEILGPTINHHQIQIFASDIDERGLNYGRKGIYTEQGLENVGEELVEKYFTKKDEIHYEVKKHIKQHILFTRHDISNDPPFVKLDAIVCRNLLIYFNNELQKQCFQIFHYALKHHGILFLGKSESVSVAPDLFEKVHSNKIFKKADASLNYQLKFSRFRGQKEKMGKETKENKVGNLGIVEVAKETLYHKYEHPFVIINEQAEIKQAHGSLRLYLEISEGTMNASLYKMANPELTTVLKALLAQVKKTKVPHTSHIVKFVLYDNPHYVKIRMVPLIYTISDSQYYIVVFEKITPDEQVLELEKKLETADFVDLRIKELEDELATKTEHLQIFTEELEATNEELQTINEELQSANEELKSSNEELETSNEELQSANEELNTANNELRLSNEQMLEKEDELQREKEQSQKNELIYRSIAENIPNGAVGILNEKFEIEYVAGRGMDRLEPDKIRGKSLPSLNPSKTEADKLRKLCAAALKGKTGNIEVRYENRHYNVRATPVEIPKGENTKILYLAQEVTDMKNNLLRLDLAMKSAKLIVFEYDFVEDYIAPNTELCKLLEIGRTKALTNADIVQKIHPEDLGKREKSMKKALKTGDLHHEVRLVQNSGVKHVRVVGKVFFDERKNPLNAIASVLDVTQDKELLNRAESSEAWFRTISNAAPLTIWMANPDKACTYVNDYWMQFTGSTREENMGAAFRNFIHPEDVKLSQDIYEKSFDDRVSFTQEYRVRKHDGTYHWFLNKGIPLHTIHGDFMGYIGCNIEIDDRKRFTERLEQEVMERTADLKALNEELLHTNMNLEEYAHVTSHDLQEPVRKIRTFNSILKDKIKGNEKAIQLSEKIEGSAERMTQLIKDVLEYSKLANGTLKFKKTDLNQVLDKVISDLELMIEERHAQIKADTLGTIEALPTQMHQLFSNLLKNSIKFNEAEPRIKINASETVGAEIKENTAIAPETKLVKMEFSDNGIGIDPEQSTKIFKPFGRLHSKDDYGGTGIGLALCKRIVQLHQGHIAVKRNKSKGSTFTVYLPLRQKKQVRSSGN